jgi:hypothetical protein
MTSERTKRRHMRKAEFVSVGPVWLTPEQAATVQKWDAENRAKALGEERKDD